MAIAKLSSFNIQNFRSIINSGWRSLSNDNITVLIGQNESGKTSVLESLHSFYTGIIIEDVLRSDNSLPAVSCCFTIDSEHTVLDLLDENRLSEELRKILSKQKDFRIIREWLPDKSSRLSVTSDETFKYFDDINQKKRKAHENSQKVISNLLTDNKRVVEQISDTEELKLDTRKRITESKKILDQKKKQLKKNRKPDEKIILEKEVELQQKIYSECENELKGYIDRLDELQSKSKEIEDQLNLGKACELAIQGKVEIKKKRTEIIQHITELEHLIELSTGDSNKKDVAVKIKKAKSDLRRVNYELSDKCKEVEFFSLVITKVFIDKLSVKSAEESAKIEISETACNYTMYTIAEKLFESIPVFEFFEDFSGLLPNKIDLEDLLNENHHVEGYKAARNFLKLAGLDSSFFREKNQRILKQKIETLNSDVTLNFQDFWSQQVGKDNKIKLHFELEHYDYTIPEKSGKPYLEFWIKDKQERLYPKQRSRGVRWFLSFYMELKATAVDKYKNRILLIDEPGLSLHARAQEDVIKVFEDLKDKMQILYCTHSPHLVKTEKLYRILAVQRANEEDDKSESLVYDPSMLSKATADTLTPIFALMGVRLSDQQFIHSANNIIVPDTITYYYLYWLAKLFPDKVKIQFIPATGMHSVPLLVNILAGWQLNFGAVLFGADSKNVYSEIKESTLLSGDKSQNRVKVFNKYAMVEDIFSALDFKKYVLHQRVGITERNSEYIMLNGLSRNILATNFVNSFNDSKVTLNVLDEISQKNIMELFTDIRNILKT